MGTYRNFAFGLALVALLGCEPPPTSASAAQELEAGLRSAGGVGMLTHAVQQTVRGETVWGDEAQTLASRIRELDRAVRDQDCASLEWESLRSVRINYSCADTLFGSVEISLRGFFDAVPRRIESVWEFRAVSLGQSVFDGDVEVVLIEGSPSVEVHLAGVLLRDASRLRADIAGALSGVELDGRNCVSISMFGVIAQSELLPRPEEGEESFYLTGSLRDLQLCDLNCPLRGSLALAGARLQEVRYEDGTASVSVDGAPATPLAVGCIPP